MSVSPKHPTSGHEDQASLAGQARFLRSVLETALDGFWVVDAQGRLLDVNPAACAISGYAREELLGKPVSELDADDRPKDVADRIGRIHRGGAERFETRHRRKDGAVIDVEVSARVVPDSGGRVVAFLREVTARNVASRAQAESEALLRAVTDALPDPVFLKDREGRWLLANPATLRAVGKSLGEVLGRTDREIYGDPRVGEAIMELDRQVMDSGQARVAEQRIPSPQGDRLFLVSKAPFRDVQGRIVGLVGHSQDITERNHLLAHVQQSQKLESVGRLAGGVAHDFNNLLSVILTYSAAMQRDLEAGLPASADDLVEIHTAGERARDLTRRLLAFARKQVIEPIPLDLSEVVRGSEKLLRRVLGERIALQTRLAPGLWTTRCDPGQVEQVIVNLAINARDAMPAGGQLLVETLNLEVSGEEAAREAAHPPGQWVVLRIRDQGSGMLPEVMAHLFEPFFTTKEVGQGTGLGLATVHGIVIQAEGHLRVESEPGHGSTFEACFPRIDEAPVAAAVAPPAPARGGHETVLVIEDDAQVRRATVRTLADAGYRVLAASGAEEALAMAARPGEALDLIVTDVVMPGLDGRALVEELRRRHGPRKALLVSGYPQEVVSDRGVLDPTIEFLSKPYTAEALRARVRKLLDQP